VKTAVAVWSEVTTNKAVNSSALAEPEINFLSVDLKIEVVLWVISATRLSRGKSPSCQSLEPQEAILFKTRRNEFSVGTQIM
jgi:hypothetical protein